MKVCTDACILGAYTDIGVGGRVLDIGTGTGLLALMAAQRNPTALVDAVEVDDTAFEQAVENVANTPFASRVQVWQGRIQDFNSADLYDRILTNPPFYTNHLRSPDPALNRALHTDELPFNELVTTVTRLLKPDGKWWILLPPYETEKLTKLAEEIGLLPFKRMSLRHQTEKPVFRVITGYSYNQQPVQEETLDIREADGKRYTPEFQTLLRDFYLIF